MQFEIRYSREAIRDLDNIWDGVFEASADAGISDRYIKDLRDTVRNKGKAPKTGTPVYYMGLFTGIYRVRFKAYLAFYRINGKTIEVSRILPGASDYLRVLFGDDEE